MSTKGQVLSFDFLMASFIFSLAFAVLFTHWVLTNIQLKETSKINTMTDKMHLISGIWFREGVPDDWNVTNVVDLGLQTDHRFNNTKMNNMETMGYSQTRELIGINNFDFYYRLYDENNVTMFEFGKYPSDPKNVMKMKRIGIHNQTLVIVETLVWE